MKSDVPSRCFGAVIFDLDGTLINSLPDLAYSMNAVLSRHGYATHEFGAYRRFVGDGMAALVRRALPSSAAADERIAATCLENMRAEYGRNWARKTKPYPGVLHLLQDLAANGLAMAVLSNKPDDFTQLTVRELLPRAMFGIVRGLRDDAEPKPHPSGALEIAAGLGVDPDKCLYVGDTDTDMLTAAHAGMYAVGVTWGFRPSDELVAHGAQSLIDRPSELLELIENNG